MPKRARSKFASFSSINKKRRLAYAEKKEQLKKEFNRMKENLKPATMEDIQHLDSKTIYLVTNLETDEQFITLDPYIRNTSQQSVYFSKIRDDSETLRIPNFSICKFEPFQSQINLETDTIKKEELIKTQKSILENISFFFGDDFIKMKIVDTKYNEKYISPTEITGEYIFGHVLYDENDNTNTKIRIPIKNIIRIKSYCE